ncbi:hypothetical protein B0J17DRAFT_294611 [Rhizoctonia solani]|nr:hypothetical protein B0J17DRAFT_294611 [Rhizoctonia solani]
MSADMYALLSASHLELTEIVASTLHIHTPPPSGSRSPLGAINLDRPRGNEIIGASMTVISLLRPSQREHLLQASRLALARTSSQLHYHLNTQARISHSHLASLLKAVLKVLKCTQLRMEASRIIDTAESDIEAPGEDRIGLSLLLTQTIIKMLQDTQTAWTPEFFSIANQVLAATTSLYVTKRPENLTADYWSRLRADALADGLPTGINWPPLPPTTDPNQIVVIRQILALATLPFTAYNCLPVTALCILYDQVKDTSAWFTLWGPLRHGQLVEQWIHEAYKLQFDSSVERPEEVAKMARRSILGIIGHVLLSNVEQLPVHWLDISWETCISPLLYLISSTHEQLESEIPVILNYLADSDNTAFESLIKFLRSSKGFPTLRSIRSHTKYSYEITAVVVALLDSHKLQVSEDNVSAILDEVTFSLGILGRNTPAATNLIEGALFCLAEAHHKGIVLPWDHRFIFENNLETVIKDHVAYEQLKISQPEATQSRDTLSRES